MNEEANETFRITEKNKQWIEKNIKENDLETALNNISKKQNRKTNNFYKNWPEISEMTFYRLVFPRTITPYIFSLYNYENAYICQSKGKSSIFYEGKQDENNISQLMYIISYFNILPCLPFSNKLEYTKKIVEITAVETIDFTDMLQIRYFKTNGFKKRITIYPKDTFFKMNKKNYISFDKLQNPCLLALYHAYLFQKDIGAKCVFLFRIIDCINANYKQNESIPNIIEYFYKRALNYSFQPIYVKRFYVNEETSKVSFLDKNDKNYFQLLKVEAKKISKELVSKYSSLRFGEIIYKIGRCSIAHGRIITGPNPVALHNFEKDLLEINDVNIILEIIVRCAIEEYNPELKNKIERRKKEYAKYNF